MDKVISKVKKLIEMHKQGLLGGEFMPEDSNPEFDKNSEENLVYFTLPMALNYQRDSYKLWQSALATWNDVESKDVFDLNCVCEMSSEELKLKLVKHKVALQPNKQPLIWRKLCETFNKGFGGVKLFFENFDCDIVKIKEYITNNKKDFPYLSGTKILNYWLYVICNYTGISLKNKHEISVAPDTHVLQSSVKLGVILKEELLKNNIREIASERWKNILQGTGIDPIDIHTPFWLWSRNGFVVEV